MRNSNFYAVFCDSCGGLIVRKCCLVQRSTRNFCNMKCWGDSKKLYRTKDEKKAIDNRYRASKGKEYWSNVSRTYHAKKKYGPLWESQLLVLQIFDECQKHMTKHEIRHKNKTLFKRAQRKARRYGSIERNHA